MNLTLRSMLEEPLERISQRTRARIKKHFLDFARQEHWLSRAAALEGLGLLGGEDAVAAIEAYLVNRRFDESKRPGDRLEEEAARKGLAEAKRRNREGGRE